MPFWVGNVCEIYVLQHMRGHKDKEILRQKRRRIQWYVKHVFFVLVEVLVSLIVCFFLSYNQHNPAEGYVLVCSGVDGGCVDVDGLGPFKDSFKQGQEAKRRKMHKTKVTLSQLHRKWLLLP